MTALRILSAAALVALTAVLGWLGGRVLGRRLDFSIVLDRPQIAGDAP